MHKKVLVLVPHPDDAEFYAGGTLAKWASEGAQIQVVVATDGARGSLVVPGPELAVMRQKEAHLAEAVLGALPPIFLNYPDFELDRLPAGELRREFMRLIRQFQPDALVAQDALVADDAHPDHRACAWAALEAVQYSTLPLVYPEHIQAGLPAHFVLDKYYYSETNARANFFVDISETFALKTAALGCHRSQVEFMVADIQQQLGRAGISSQDLISRLGADPQDWMAFAMRKTAEDTGKLCGYPLAEAFCHERFNLYPFDFSDPA